MVSKKRYFSSKETVAGWWKPETLEKKGKLAPLYAEQHQILSDLTDWKGKFVIDAGCGYGRFSSDIYKWGGMVVAMDLSVDMLNSMRDFLVESGVEPRSIIIIRGGY